DHQSQIVQRSSIELVVIKPENRCAALSPECSQQLIHIGNLTIEGFLHEDQGGFAQPPLGDGGMRKIRRDDKYHVWTEILVDRKVIRVCLVEIDFPGLQLAGLSPLGPRLPACVVSIKDHEVGTGTDF